MIESEECRSSVEDLSLDEDESDDEVEVLLTREAEHLIVIRPLRE